MAISLWVYFYDMPGGALERKIQKIAKTHGGEWTGQGTNVMNHERDNSFRFEDEDQTDSFRVALAHQKVDLVRVAKQVEA